MARYDVSIGVKQPTRGRAGHPLPPYSALLQVGFDRRGVAANDRTLLPSDFTLTAGSPIPVHNEPSSYPSLNRRRYVSVPLSVSRIAAEAWELPSTLSSGARTFLPPNRPDNPAFRDGDHPVQPAPSQ